MKTSIKILLATVLMLFYSVVFAEDDTRAILDGQIRQLESWKSADTCVHNTLKTAGAGKNPYVFVDYNETLAILDYVAYQKYKYKTTHDDWNLHHAFGEGEIPADAVQLIKKLSKRGTRGMVLTRADYEQGRHHRRRQNMRASGLDDKCLRYDRSNGHVGNQFVSELRNGHLYCDHNKGKTVSNFINAKINANDGRRVTSVFLIDDLMENLDSVKQACVTLGLPFYGILITAAEARGEEIKAQAANGNPYALSVVRVCEAFKNKEYRPEVLRKLAKYEKANTKPTIIPDTTSKTEAVPYVAPTSTTEAVPRTVSKAAPRTASKVRVKKPHMKNVARANKRYLRKKAVRAKQINHKKLRAHVKTKSKQRHHG
ncbi:hypothetical protein FACS189472_00090 [Alphaproteobacteria bacterium]|nr:hypothetical protein FACS189472_00090 [Alphaproteobacteria bacterium]